LISFALKKKLCHYFFIVSVEQTVRYGRSMKSGEMGLMAVAIQLSRNPLKCCHAVKMARETLRSVYLNDNSYFKMAGKSP